MKTKLLTFTAVLAAISFSNVSSAMLLSEADYSDIDLIRMDLTYDSPTISGKVFDINAGNDDGDKRDKLYSDGFAFDPDKFIVDDAIVGFLFADFTGITPVATKVFFDIGGYFHARSFSGTSGTFEGESVYNISFNSSDYPSLGGNLLLDVQEDGVVEWSVSLDLTDPLLSQDVRLNLYTVFLGVKGHRATVPDTGSTAALFGLAIFGVMFVGRRRK